MYRSVKLAVARLLGQDRRKPVARILTSKDGGPVRRIIDGRKNHYTGFFISVKSDFGQMPWESRHGERSVLLLAEASSRVVALVTQPHRLEISVNEQKAPLIYFPDLQLKVHPSFLYDLENGVPFCVAALSSSKDEPDDRLKTVIIEIKDDRDHRQFQPKYIRKLELAQEIYRRMGIAFHIVQRGEDVFPFHLEVATSVVSWRNTAVNQVDVWTVECALREGSLPASEVVAVLGGGPFGWGKLRALHVRRIVEMDLTEMVSSDTRVWLLHNNFLRVRVAA